MTSPKAPTTTELSRFPGSSFKYTPMRHLRVLFVSFVQGLFGAAPRGCYHWEPDDENSEIIITNENRLDAEVLNKRPGITFTRGPVQFYSFGIDDRRSFDFATERKEKAVLVPGTMTINVVSRVMLEAEDLAWVVMEHIWLLRDLFLKMGFFELGRTPQMGSPSPAGSIVSNDQGDEYTVVPVAVPFQFPRNSAFTPLGKQIVNNIQQTLSLNAPQLVGSVGPPMTSHEYPASLHECPPSSFAPRASNVYQQSPDPAGMRQNFLPKQRHPLDPSKTVTVRVVRPHQPGRGFPHLTPTVPIKDPCVEES